MTFSLGVKEELCLNFPDQKEKALSEIKGVILASGLGTQNKDENFKIVSDNKEILKYIENLLVKYLKLQVDVMKNEWLIFKKSTNISEILNSKKQNCFNENIIGKSFIKGAFLACGSMSNPEKGYHMEFVFQNKEDADFLNNFLNYYNLNSKIINRKIYTVVYIKEADNISQILNMIGAHDCLLKFEDIRVNKEYSNNKNRIRNCFEANEDRSIITSVRQVRAIMTIQEKIGLEKLPKALREIAEIRLEHKELPLKDLGMFLKNPIGKSGVSHRLKKIEKIAEELK